MIKDRGELIEEEDANKIEFGWDINLACASLVARSAGLLVHLNGFMLISVVVVTNGVSPPWPQIAN